MWISAEDLRRLEDLRSASSTHGILSLYLPIDPAVAQHHGHIAALMNVLRELRQTAPATVAARVEEEAAKVLSFARDDYVPHGSCLIVFSSLPAKLWETFSFQLPSPALARFGERPYLLPIAAFSEDYSPAMVALVDHQEARLYSLRLGELLECTRVSTDVPGHNRQGGWAAAHYERDRQHHMDDHLRSVAEALQASDGDAPFEYLVLAGTNEITHALSALLPQGLRDKLAGDFAAEMFASDAMILDSARDVIARKERGRERGLIERLIQTALEGGRSALGVDETLQTLREGRARSLVLSESAAFQPTGETAYTLAEANGLPVEMVHGEAAALLEPYGGIAAELRY